MEHLRDRAEEHLGGDQRRPPRGVGPEAGGGDEEVEQRRRLARLGDEHEPARPEPGQLRLGDERDGHGRERGVDRVAAGAQDLRTGVSGQRMARGDDPVHGAGP